MALAEATARLHCSITIRPVHAMLRGFTDSTGVEWRVWEVFPAKAGTPTGVEKFSQSSIQNTAFAEGWLCFECQNEKRRLAPIPSGWELNELRVLEQLCAEATPVSLRRSGGRAFGAA